jgi:hypothetical protein
MIKNIHSSIRSLTKTTKYLVLSKKKMYDLRVKLYGDR